MARAELGHCYSNSFNNSSGNNSKNGGGRSKWWWWCSWSCKRTTLLVCCINIFVALFVLHSLYSSLYLYPFSSQTTFKYTVDQIKKMEESLQIRKALEPTELIRLVHELKHDLLKEETQLKLPWHLKQLITDEILMTLRGLNASANSTVRREAVERWRLEKLREAKKLVHEKGINSSIPIEEAGMFLKALESDWPALSEEIGLYVPVQIINTEHDDEPDGQEEFEEEILPGRKLPPECHAELHTDYGGDAVRWGLTHHKESAYDCCMACLNLAKNAKPGEKKCNIWVYCPSETGCHSPDIYKHRNQECWLKYSEKPRANFKDTYSESYRNAHPNAPLIVPWVSGVVSV